MRGDLSSQNPLFFPSKRFWIDFSSQKLYGCPNLILFKSISHLTSGVKSIWLPDKTCSAWNRAFWIFTCKNNPVGHGTLSSKMLQTSRATVSANIELFSALRSEFFKLRAPVIWILCVQLGINVPNQGVWIYDKAIFFAILNWARNPCTARSGTLKIKSPSI